MLCYVYSQLVYSRLVTDANLQESYLVEWWKANFFIRKPILFGTWDGESNLLFVFRFCRYVEQFSNIMRFMRDHRFIILVIGTSS